MKINKIFYASVLIAALSICRAFSQESSSQVLQTTLPQILSISKVIVDSTEHERDMPLSKVKIVSSNQDVPGQNVIGLTPIQVKIHTNMITPISISANFDELKHFENKYNFNSANLRFEPSSYTINNPYDNVITGNFTPVATMYSDVVPGVYEGKVTFTLGAI